jgi:hypothetical protein
MPVLYTRVSDPVSAYLAQLAADTGLSMARIVDTLLDEARRRNWSIEEPRMTVKDPG